MPMGSSMGQILRGHIVGGITEERYTLTTAGGVQLSLNDGNVQRLTMGGAHAITMPVSPGEVSASYVLLIDCAGSTPTWGASPTIKWLTFDNVAPVLVTTSGKIYVLSFIWDLTNTRWLGFQSGKEA
jgi:hypothetical protein